MLRLTLFGGVSLVGSNATTDLANRGWQRAVLLALLGGAGPRGIAREQLVALLWPDVDEERGRHSLNEILSRLRRESERPELLVGTLRVALNGADVSVDVWDFAEAVSARHVERAVQLYRGPFADGVRTTGLPELEQRLEVQRAEQRRAFVEILEYAARTATDRRDFPAAARWWQRIADVDPLSERIACELVGAYAAIPDVAGALRAARLHETLVQQQLGVPPGARIREWSARLSREPTPALQLPDSTSTQPVAGAGRVTPREQVERIRGQLSARYAITHLLEEGSIFSRLRAHVPTEGARAVDVVVMQPRAAAFVREDMFVQAMERTIALTGRHILPTLDVGVRHDVVYFVTSPMPELTLRALMRREGTLAIDAALRLARCIARALTSAHERSVYHGDLRPRHVGILPDGDGIVGGFGVVPALLGERGHGDDTAVLSYGSPRYLSPEQQQGGRSPDARSDIYAFGCTLYHMLAGEPPVLLTLEDPAQVVRELRRRRPNLPKYLADIISQCIAAHPADRLADGRALVRALEESPN